MLVVRDDSAVEFSEAFNVNQLIVDSNSTVEIAEGTFFNELNVLFSTVFEQDDVVAFDLASIFGDSTGIAEDLIEVGTFTVFDGNNQEWAVAYDGGSSFTVGNAIPEPSTYAAILSLLAAGFSIRMKRRNSAK